jgi:AcrR family transcriptional regulator
MTGPAPPRVNRQRRPRPVRRDAARNHQKILTAARAVLGEAGADATMEDIASRAGVGVGTVYRRFASKDALVDELLRLALADIVSAADRALQLPDGHGLEELLHAMGQSFADHARYASLLLQRQTDPAAIRRISAAIDELTARAAAAETVSPATTVADITALIWAMRGLTQAASEADRQAWRRFLRIHLAGLRSTEPGSVAR